MSDPIKKPKNEEDIFAHLLEERHEKLIAGDDRDSTLGVQNEEDDARVQSAMMVLQLLEKIKPAPSDQPREQQAAVETHDDPSTKKLDHSSPLAPSSVENLIPNLRQLGRFEILEQVGRGGFGIVVRGRDPQLNRDVAIKIPRFETALSPQSRQRFEREAKAAAALNHAGIVSVLEQGSEQGIDFIVTEFVDGENLATHLARGNTFSPKESAKLTSKIADALEHAHQRNVLHRDIKPSNILLAKDSSGPQPLVADFGLAAMSDQQDFTQTGAALGTPAYMSPEQAAGNKDQLGPATDVYGLGTILYELLTGQSPFAELPILEMLDAIHRRDPAPPRTMNPAIPRDIESICLKCLEKSPDRRYRSAQELQADLQRFISDTPVLARRITPINRSLRWVRRNPVLATVGMSSFVFLFIALIASFWGWASTSAALGRESQAKNEARQTVNQYFTDVADNNLLDVPGLLPLRQQLLVGALVYYQRYLENTASTPDVLEELEFAYFRVGKIQSELGEQAKAIESFENALSLQDELLASNAHDSRLLARKFETLRRLGQIQNNIGNDEQGLEYLESAIEGQRQLVESNPHEKNWQYELSRSLQAKANFLKEKGELKQAIEFGDEVIALMADLIAQDPENQTYRRDLAGAYVDQGNAIAKTGDIDASASSVDLANQIFRSLVDSDSRTPKDMHGLAIGLSNRAGKYLSKRQAEPARPLLEEAAMFNDHLILMFPNVDEYLQQRLAILSGLGFCYSRLKMTDKAVEVFYSSIESLKILIQKNPENSRLVFGLAVAQLNLGSTLAQQTDDPNEARRLLLESEANLESCLEKTPNFFDAKIASAKCQLVLAAIYNQMEDHELALQYADRSIASLEAITAEKPGVPQFMQDLGNALHNRADSLEFLNRWEDSVPVWRTAVELGGHFKVRSQLRLASALAQTGDVTESNSILESLANEASTKTQFRGSLGRAQAAIARAWSKSDDVEPAQIEALLDQAFESIQTWLNQPQNLKMSNVEKLRTLDVYELLLQRDDFNQLLEEASQTIQANRNQ